MRAAFASVYTADGRTRTPDSLAEHVALQVLMTNVDWNYVERRPRLLLEAAANHLRQKRNGKRTGNEARAVLHAYAGLI